MNGITARQYVLRLSTTAVLVSSWRDRWVFCDSRAPQQGVTDREANEGEDGMKDCGGSESGRSMKRERSMKTSARSGPASRLLVRCDTERGNRTAHSITKNWTVE